MAVKAEIFGEGPGLARIRLSGIDIPAGDCTIQIQRNQSPDSYLGLTGQWQSSPDCWHQLSGRDVTAISGGIEFLIGERLVDPILTVQAQNAFRLSLRSTAGAVTTTALVPSTRQPLLASAARHEAPAEVPEPIPAPKPVEAPIAVEAPAPTMTLKADPADHFGAPIREADDREKSPAPAKSRKGLLLGVLAAVVVLGGAAAAAYFYLKPQGQQPAQTAAVAPTEQSTREILQAFMKDNPDAAAIVGKADKMKSDGNIDAAVYLYRQGADRGDAHSALQLGILYDPGETVAAAGAPANAPANGTVNTLAKSSDTAAFWYGKAADAGLAEAQRRLGNLLTKDHPADSGEFKNGVTLLQAASKQGDAEASAKLKELGQ
ncbi:MAG: hypothetical protein ABWY00_10930 [Dongiaceae bacterium]